MRKLKTLFALLVLSFFTIGNVWADKITRVANIVSGRTYYIGATTSTTDYYLSVDGSTASGDAVAGTAVTSKANAATFIFTGSGSTWTIKFADSNNYLSLSSSKANGKVIVNTTANWTITNHATKDLLQLACGTTYYLQKNNSGTQFGSYANTQTDVWLEEVSADASITADPEEVTDVPCAGVTNQTIELGYSNIENYETEVSVHPNSDGTGSLSPAWLTASVSDADDYATITYSVSANDGAARAAYIKVYTTDGDKEATTIIPVTQVKYSAPTGTFELFSGDIEAGEYVICSGSSTTAMKNAVSNNRLAYTTVTITDGSIVNPDSNVIWKLEPLTGTDAGYWTFYNEAAEKYAAFNATNGNATLLDDVTDYAKFSHVAETAYDFENKGKTGKVLRYNNGYGFASYGTGTGAELKLYLKNAPSVSAVTNDATPAPLAELDLGDVGQTWDASITFGLSCKKMVAAQSPLTLTVPDGFTFNISTGVKTQTIEVSDGTNAISDITIYKNTTTAGNINTNLTITGGGLAETVNIPLKMNVHAPEITVTKNSSPISTLNLGTYYRYSFANVAHDTIHFSGQYLKKDQEMLLSGNALGHFAAVTLGDYNRINSASDGTLDVDIVVKGYTNNPVGTHQYVEDGEGNPTEEKYQVYLCEPWNNSIDTVRINCQMTIASSYAISLTTTGNDEENGFQIKVYDSSSKLQDSTITNYSVRGYAGNANDIVVIEPVPAVGYEFDSWNYTSDASHITVLSESKAQLRIKADQAVSITGTFTKVCDPLAAPVEVDGYPTLAWNGYHYTATFKWNKVANASGYKLNVHNVADGDSHARDFDRNITDASDVVTYELSGLLGEAEYAYSIMAVGSGDYCEENALTENTLETEDWPAATLTLSENGKNRAWGEDLKVASQIALPTSVQTGVVGKVLVGWSAVTIAETNTKPTSDFYAPGATYTIETTADVLKAVYGTVTPGATKYELVDDLTLDETYIFVSSNTAGSAYALPGTGLATSASSTSAGVAVTVSSVNEKSTVTTGNSAIEFTYSSISSGKLTLTIAAAEDSNNKLVINGNGIGRVASNQKAYWDENGLYGSNSGNNKYYYVYLDGTDFKAAEGASGRVYAYEKSAEPNDTSAYATSGARVLDTPTFLPAEGKKTSVTNVTISATEGTIYYTINGDDPTNASTAYSSAIVLSENGTYVIKAIAIDAQNNQSEIATATYTIELPLTTMDEIFAKAKEVDDTETSVEVTFNNWVVSGVAGSNAYVTDGTKGFIIYSSGHGLEVNDKLSGTVACKIQLYYGAAELKNITSSSTGLTITKDGVITPLVKNIGDLDSINTGAPIIVQNVTYNSTSQVLADASSNQIKPYNKLYNGMSFTNAQAYDVTGIYLQYNTTKQIMPRSSADIADPTETGFDNIDSDVKAVKVLRDGQIYILRGEKVYTIQGQLVK